MRAMSATKTAQTRATATIFCETTSKPRSGSLIHIAKQCISRWVPVRKYVGIAPHDAATQRIRLALWNYRHVSFAGTLPATRVALTGFEPVFLTAARGTIAGTTGLLVLLVTRRSIPPSRDRLGLIAGALCSVLAFPLLAALALETVPAGHGGVVQGILPLATAIAAAIFAHERPSLGFWLASLVGAAIVIVFVFRRNAGGAPSAGDIFLIGTVVAGALGYTFAGRLAARMPAWEVISWQVVILLSRSHPS